MGSDPKAIHKTVLNEVVSEIIDAYSAITKIATSKEGKEAKDAARDYAKNKWKDIKDNRDNFKSLTRASENLTLVFPIIASKSISINTDMIIMKAIERKAVTMLQMVFAAIQVADKDIKDIYGYISKFHHNIDPKTFGIDDVIEISGEIDKLRERHSDIFNDSASLVRAINAYDKFLENAIIEDNKKNTNFYMDSINRKSLENYTISESGYGNMIISEAIINRKGKYEGKDNDDDMDTDDVDELRKDASKKEIANDIDAEEWENRGRAREEEKADIKSERNRRDNDYNARQKMKYDKETRLDRDIRNAEIEDYREKNRENRVADMAKYRRDFFKDQVVDTDIKKANELEPSIMMVNFYTAINDKLEALTNALIGVKAKLYAIDSSDIISRVSTKAQSTNGLLQFIRATTREISFFRDFLLAIDKAKIDAVSYSKKGSSSKMWKVLERRAINNKSKKYKSGAAASPITTLLISQEEVEYMKKNGTVDLYMYSTARKVMEAYNFMCICVVDENMETAKFIFDTGDDKWETYSFTSLERENSDSAYKKVINLMSKIR